MQISGDSLETIGRFIAMHIHKLSSVSYWTATLSAKWNCCTPLVWSVASC